MGDCLFGAPRLVGVDHDLAAGANRVGQKPDPVQILLEVGGPDLDLECLVAQLVGVAEQLGVVSVAQVIVEPAGIGAHLVALTAENPVQRHPRFLGNEVPQGDLQRFMERQAKRPDIATARL